MLRNHTVCYAVVALYFCCLSKAMAAERSWNAPGSGDWSDANNWVGALIPGGSDDALFSNTFTSGAVVNADEGISAIQGFTVDNPDNNSLRIFDGMLTLDWLNFIKGRVELRGSIRTGSKNVISVGNAEGETAWLTISSNTVVSAINKHGLYVGDADNAKGRVTIKNGAQLLLSTSDTDLGISLGREIGSVGSIVQEGGLVSSAGRFLPGYFGYGYYELSGGVLDLPYGGGNTRYRLAVKNDSTALLYQRGGQLLVNTNGVTPSFHFDICGGYDGTEAVYYADGGSAWFDMDLKLLSESSTAESHTYAELTVDRYGHVESTGTVYLRGANHLSQGTAVVNLNHGGTLRTSRILRGHSGGSSYLNGDGGVLDLVQSSENAGLFSNIPETIIYEGGLEIRHSGTGGSRITGELKNPGGWGVSGLTISSSGGGYLAPPRVTFSGGSGSNATAVAFIDHNNGMVTSAVVTCRGQGYASNDVVTASVNGGGGSGCVASAVLTENKSGPLILSGGQRLVMYSQPKFAGEYVAHDGLLLQSSRDDGAPCLAGITVSGKNAVFQNGSGSFSDNTPAKWDLINPLATLTMGGKYGGGVLELPCGSDDTVFQQHYALLEVAFGRSLLTTLGYPTRNGAALIFDKIQRRPGGAIQITTTTNLSVFVEGDTSEIAFGTGNPVLPGVFIGKVSTLSTLDSNKIVALERYDDGFGATSNYWMMTSASAEGFEVNSLRLEDANVLTLQSGATTVVGSGMVVASDGGAHNTRITGGALTSGNGVDLMLYDFHVQVARRNLAGGKSGLIIDALITDNGTTPIALFACGRAWSAWAMSIATGPLVVLNQATNTYSGGTYILDTALSIADDLSLGPVPSSPTNNIMTSGMAMLRAPADENVTINLHSNRNIQVCDGGLTFFGDDNFQYGRVLFNVAGNISGKGVLVMNHWTGPGVRSVVQLSGDNSGFEGDLAVHGLLRLVGAKSLPSKSNIDLCGRGDVDTGGGILEMAGVFDFAPGSERGEVRWGEVNDVAPGYANDNSGAFGGGFAAYGAPLTVNLGGDSRQLTMGVDGFSPARLRLQSDYATDEVTWMNPVDVTTNTLLVQVAHNSSSKRVLWRGAVTSSSVAGGGGFQKIGSGKLVLADGADFGPIEFAANNTVELLVTNQQTLACNMRGSNVFIEKYGSGRSTLSGSNTYLQATRIYEGTLCVNGTNTAGGTFTVWPGAVLGGDGVAAPKSGTTVTVNGTLAPGTDVDVCGNLTLGDTQVSTTLNLNGTLALDLDLNVNDRVTVNGDLVIDKEGTIDFTALNENVWTARREETITVLSWTGSLTGGDLTSININGLPRGWSLKVNTPDQEAYLAYASPGTVIFVH